MLQPSQTASLHDPLGRPLRALINNAGISVNAPVEALPIAEWRRQFEVNLFGHIAMTQALLPALLRSSGTVVNISSVGGKVALPTYGAYAGTKFALEAASDSLRREVADLGVRVVVVEPGAVRTEMLERGVANADRLKADMTSDQLERYGDLVVAVSQQARSFGTHGVSAERAGKVIADAASAPRPRTRYTIGRDAAILVRLARVLPDRFLDRDGAPWSSAALRCERGCVVIATRKHKLLCCTGLSDTRGSVCGLGNYIQNRQVKWGSGVRKHETDRPDLGDQLEPSARRQRTPRSGTG